MGVCPYFSACNDATVRNVNLRVWTCIINAILGSNLDKFTKYKKATTTIKYEIFLIYLTPLRVLKC